MTPSMSMQMDKVGRDKIDLTAMAANNIDEFGDLNIEVAGSNSIIHFDANNSLTVVGVNDLAAGDFSFEVYSRRMEEFRALFEAMRSVDVWRVATSYDEICDRLARSRQQESRMT